MIASMPAAIIKVTQPPSTNLNRLAPRKTSSIARNGSITAMVRGHDHFHRDTIIIDARIAVTIMVPVTAMPYAAASRSDAWKVTTRAITPASISQLTAGR